MTEEIQLRLQYFNQFTALNSLSNKNAKFIPLRQARPQLGQEWQQARRFSKGSYQLATSTPWVLRDWVPRKGKKHIERGGVGMVFAVAGSRLRVLSIQVIISCWKTVKGYHSAILQLPKIVGCPFRMEALAEVEAIRDQVLSSFLSSEFWAVLLRHHIAVGWCLTLTMAL